MLVRMLCLAGAQRLYGQFDRGNAAYSFDGLRADAQVAHLRKGVIGAKRPRHRVYSGGGGDDALVAHPVKEEDEITANDDDDNGGGGKSNNGTMLETTALIQRRRRRKRQKGDDKGEGDIYVANLSSAGLLLRY